MSGTHVHPFQRYWGFGVFGCFGVVGCFGVFGGLWVFCVFGVFGDFGVFGVWLCISSRDRSQSHIRPPDVHWQGVFNRAWPANERLMRCGRAVDKKWELLNHTPLANNWELLISAYAP